MENVWLNELVCSSWIFFNGLNVYKVTQGIYILDYINLPREEWYNDGEY
jgi:hypothetical protein